MRETADTVRCNVGENNNLPISELLHCTMYNCTNARNAGHCEVQCGRETADITSKKGKRYLKKGNKIFERNG